MYRVYRAYKAYRVFRVLVLFGKRVIVLPQDIIKMKQFFIMVLVILQYIKIQQV